MSQPDYFTAYENFAVSRDDAGVILVRLHTGDGPLVFSGRVHHDFPALLDEIVLPPAASDPALFAPTTPARP